MTTIGIFDVKYVGDTTSLDRANTKAKQSLDQTAKAAEQATGSAAALGQATTRMTASLAKTSQATEELTGTARNLQSTLREMTTAMLGNSVAAIAVGTAIGNLAVQLAGQLLGALVSATTQVARLHNELLLLAGVGSQAAQVMSELRSIAAGSNTSLGTLVERFTAFNQSLIGTGVTLSEQIELIKEQDRLLNALGQHTVTGAMSKLAEETGLAVLEFDRMTGISNFLITSLNTVSAVVSGVRDALAAINSFMNRDVLTRIQQLRVSIAQLGIDEVQAQLRDVQADIRAAEMEREVAGRRAVTSAEDLAKLREKEAVLQERLTRAQTEAHAATMRSVGLHRQLEFQLGEERRIAGLSRNDQEIENRLLQINLQFRQLNVTLSTQELAAYRAQLAAIQAATIAQREQTALAQNLVTALSAIPVAFGNIFTPGGGLDLLRGNFSSFTAELTGFHTAAFENAFARMDAAMRQSGATAAEIAAMKRGLLLQEQALILDTASKAASALTTIFPKSKAAAIGAAVINTAVAITRALQLPWPFNWIQAGLVAASGAAQIATIRSASPSGGSTPTVSGGGGATGGDEGGGMAPQLITIEMQAGQLFSSEQVANLMGLINEQVKNGGALISTRVM